MIAPAAEPLNARLIDSLYTEAMLLADEARAYFEQSGRADRVGLDPLTRVNFSCESLKVTTRLMHVIAWLLGQRAHAAFGTAAGAPSEMDAPDTGQAQRKLGNASESDPVLLARLPDDARALIESSRDLYARVGRLAGGGAGETGPGPARALMSRLERSL